MTPIYIPMEREGQEYVLIDTAGIRRRKNMHEAVEKFSVIQTLKAVEDANVVLLVIDARENISDQDLSLPWLCPECGAFTGDCREQMGWSG